MDKSKGEEREEYKELQGGKEEKKRPQKCTKSMSQRWICMTNFEWLSNLLHICSRVSNKTAITRKEVHHRFSCVLIHNHIESFENILIV